MFNMKDKQLPTQVMLWEFQAAMDEARSREGGYAGYGKDMQGEEAQAFRALLSQLTGGTLTREVAHQLDDAAFFMSGESMTFGYRYGLRDAFRFLAAAMMWGVLPDERDLLAEDMVHKVTEAALGRTAGKAAAEVNMRRSAGEPRHDETSQKGSAHMSATVGERIKELYTAFEMDRAAFARLMGFEETLVERVERGVLLPSYCLMGMICEEFGANIDWMRQGGGEMLCKQPYHAIPLRNLRLELTPNGLNGDTPLVDELQMAGDDKAWEERSTPEFALLDEKLKGLAGRRMTPKDCMELCDITNTVICEERRVQYGFGMRDGMQLMKEALSLQGVTPASAYEALHQAMMDKLTSQNQLVEVGA